MYGWRQLASSTCEALASDGFVVFAVDHGPSAMISRPYLDLDAAIEFDYNVPNNINKDQERNFYMGGMDRRSKEMAALIDYITHDYMVSKFVLDKSRINIFGHSFGGGTCCTLACRDSRVKHAVLLDSWMYPGMLNLLQTSIYSFYLFSIYYLYIYIYIYIYITYVCVYMCGA